MTQSTTLTTSQTFTIADAKYLASRISTALTQIRLHYGDADGYLTDQKIQDFAVEAAVLLKFGLLDTVKYGFQRDGNWVFAIRYTVNALNQLELADESPGGIYSQANVSGASWHSYLTRRHNTDVTAEERAAIIADLPIKRDDGNEPSSAGGQWVDDRTHFRNGIGMQRGQFRS